MDQDRLPFPYTRVPPAVLRARPAHRPCRSRSASSHSCASSRLPPTVSSAARSRVSSARLAASALSGSKARRPVRSRTPPPAARTPERALPARAPGGSTSRPRVEVGDLGRAWQRARRQPRSSAGANSPAPPCSGDAEGAGAVAVPAAGPGPASGVRVVSDPAAAAACSGCAPAQQRPGPGQPPGPVGGLGEAEPGQRRDAEAVAVRVEVVERQIGRPVAAEPADGPPAGARFVEPGDPPLVPPAVRTRKPFSAGCTSAVPCGPAPVSRSSPRVGRQQHAAPVRDTHRQVEPAAYDGGGDRRRQPAGGRERGARQVLVQRRPGRRAASSGCTGGSARRRAPPGRPLDGAASSQARGPLLAAAPVQLPVEVGEQQPGQLVLFGAQVAGVGDGGGYGAGGGAVLDAADERLEVRAVDGGVVEVRAGAVAVGVEAAAAGADDGALPAGLADVRRGRAGGPGRPGARRPRRRGGRRR